MAATKRSAEIAAKKEAEREGLLKQYAELVALVSKVPAFVNQGSHTLSVSWRTLAESVFHLRPQGPKAATLYSLTAESKRRNILKKQLAGEVSLPGLDVDK